MSISKSFLVCASIVALYGCAVGPDYVAPVTDVPAWQGDGDEMSAPEPFWLASEYADEYAALAGLVEQALDGNKDIAIAQARIAESRAQLTAARGARLPALALDTRYTAFEQSIRSPQSAGPLIEAGVIPRTGEFYNASLQASWEIDIFGLRAREIEAGLAAMLATEAEAEAIALQVVAETISAWSDWQSFSQRVEVAERNIALQSKTLEIISGKVRLGLARRLDEVRAESALAELQSRLPGLQAATVGAAQRLAVLLGTDAGALALSPQRVTPPKDLAIGTKADMLRRRPDLRIAERSLAAATAQQGAATAAMFPQLTLTAAGGFEAGGIDDLFSGDARNSGIVPFVRWPIFQGRRLRAAKAAADARQQQALASYEKAVLQAFADAEAAIAGQRAANGALGAVVKAAASAAEAESLASKLYQQGLTDYLSLLDAQRQLALLEDAEIESRNQAVQAAARLYKSLGGSWQPN